MRPRGGARSRGLDRQGFRTLHALRAVGLSSHVTAPLCGGHSDDRILPSFRPPTGRRPAAGHARTPRVGAARATRGATRGCSSILSKVDLANPGGARSTASSNLSTTATRSIGGLTGGLRGRARRRVDVARRTKSSRSPRWRDGQESSTRYITMDAANLPTAEELGIPADLAPRWS
jgi:hypothetical protein